MSFVTYSPVIQEGDIAILFRSHSDLSAIEIKRGTVIAGKTGLYKHDDFIGKPWGSKFACHTGRGDVILLHPTPELWTKSLPHRTQILYLADISLITQQLRLRPGAYVVESGTGSGSFSHALARTIAPHGHLHTFEYHQDRAEAAKAEFAAHRIDHLVTVKCQDVCESGFGLTDAVDAVFLDLPAPWLAVQHAKQALRKDVVARICCFSPCIEQVQRTCDALRAAGFVDVVMHECLIRHHEVRNVAVKPVEAARVLRSRRIDSPKGDKGSESEGTPMEADTPVVQNSGSSSSPVQERQVLTCRPIAQQRGHTSYLTFASLVPTVQESV
ncbi:tRNA (adenine-N(1)-)-methyltransferase catalytic subunit trm61 [Sorochytrium milnesiophthora]